jgi:hypothetical protein
MALSFGISPTQNCGQITFNNCSTYCTPTNYDVAYVVALIDRNTYQTYGDAIILKSDSYTTSAITDPTTQVAWSGSFFTTLYGNIVLISGLSVGINTITLTVTDDDGLVSTTQIKVKMSSTSAQPEWVVSPSLNITTTLPNPDLVVGFSDQSTLVDTSIDNTTVAFRPESPSAPLLDSLPQNHDYGVIGTYSAVYSYEEDTDGTSVSTTVPIVITADETDCTGEMTESGLDSIILLITDPDGNSYTEDITDSFFDAPITLNSEDIADLETDTWASGIWTFRVVVTKDNGVQIVDEIKVTIICSEECAFQAMLINYAQEETDCCDSCKQEKEENIILIRTYIQAIKNANACGSQTQITKFLSLIQRKLANNPCGC